MWVYDAETLKFLAVNQVAIRDYGYREDEFLGMTIADIRSPKEAKRKPACARRTALEMVGSCCPTSCLPISMRQFSQLTARYHPSSTVRWPRTFMA